MLRDLGLVFRIVAQRTTHLAALATGHVPKHTLRQ